MDIYLVGGAVRDQLLGLPVKERDWVVVGATPQQLVDQGFKPVGNDFPVFLHPDTREEYALALAQYAKDKICRDAEGSRMKSVGRRKKNAESMLATTLESTTRSMQPLINKSELVC